MKNISVLVTVYNEEERIENFIKSFLWSDDLVISVRENTTDATKEIAQQYDIRIVDNPYNSDQDEGALQFNKDLISSLRNNWIMIVTASDLISPKLVSEMLQVINDPELKEEVIMGPGSRYILGINDRRSPWFAGYNNWTLAYKKDALQFGNQVHEEIKVNSTQTWKLNFSKEEHSQGFLHLTHQDATSAIERSVRYCSTAEPLKYHNEKDALKSVRGEMLKSIVKIVFREKTWMLGWDGLAIICNYMIYYMMKYLFVWDKFRCKGTERYRDMAEGILKEWDVAQNIYTEKSHVTYGIKEKTNENITD